MGDRQAPESGPGRVTHGILQPPDFVFIPAIEVQIVRLAVTVAVEGIDNAVTISVETRGFVWIEDLIDLVEDEASSELYGLLKRPDEKYVTEKAYNNPKFVEDMVRDIATRLNADERIAAYTVESENFESIHNHSAYALIEHVKEEA